MANKLGTQKINTDQAIKQTVGAVLLSTVGGVTE
jgi:hypothetical protein